MKNNQLQLNWLSQCVFKASFVDSDCLLDIIGQEILCQRNTSFKQYIEKTWHDSNSTLEYVHNHMLPALVAQCMVIARLHHDVNVMDVARNPARLKQRGHQVHTIIISWDTQITPENCPLSDEYSPQHPSELLWATLENCRLYCHWWFFLLKLETALPQARSFQPVACPINSAPSPTKFNTSCPPPDPSALSFIKSIIASLQLLASDSHCECELEHSMVMISSFPESYFFSVLGQVDGVCLLRQNDLPEVDGTSACSRCACVRACTITITAETNPVQVSPWRRLSLGSRVQRPCSNPSVSKFIPI